VIAKSRRLNYRGNVKLREDRKAQNENYDTYTFIFVNGCARGGGWRGGTSLLFEDLGKSGEKTRKVG